MGAKKDTQIEDACSKITETPEEKNEKVNEPDTKQSEKSLMGAESKVKVEEDMSESKTDINTLSPQKEDKKSSKVEDKDKEAKKDEEKAIDIEKNVSESQSDLPSLKTDDKSVESSQESKVEHDLVVNEKSSADKKNTQNEDQNTIDSKLIENKESKAQDDEVSPKEDSKFVPGVLEVTIKKASELVNNDRIGKSDPYVKIRYGDTEFGSKTIQNTLEPEWNFSCKFDILNLDEPYIHINVYDDDFGKDNIEGCYSLSLKEAMSDLPDEGYWYNLVGCKTGKVFICTSFTPIEMEDTSTVKPVQPIKSDNIPEKDMAAAELKEGKDSHKKSLEQSEKLEQPSPTIEAKGEFKDSKDNDASNDETKKDPTKPNELVAQEDVESSPSSRMGEADKNKQ